MLNITLSWLKKKNFIKNKLVNKEIYKEIFFSNLLRDNDFPAVMKSKGYNLKGAIKVVYESLLRDFLEVFKVNDSALENSIWVYIESVNQFRALEFLADLENVVFVTDKKSLANKFKEKKICVLIHNHRLLKRFNWIFRRLFYKKIFKNSFKTHFNTIFKYDGVFESLCSLIGHYKPKAVIMSNDHNVFCRALLYASKQHKVYSIYLQHAAVTNLFPPLKFDLNLLEGIDSLNKYKEAGDVEGSVELVGMPKFDDYYEFINKNESVNSIGIALNNGDNFIEYFELVDNIYLNFPSVKIIFRFHPSIDTNSIQIPHYAILSDTKVETSFTFLKNIDVLFACNSSIHLEACMLNVKSLNIEFEGNKLNDYYGFIKNGLIDNIRKDDVLNWLSNDITNKPNVRSKAKYYIDTIDSEWDGRSKKMIFDLLKKKLN